MLSLGISAASHSYILLTSCVKCVVKKAVRKLECLAEQWIGLPAIIYTGSGLIILLLSALFKYHDGFADWKGLEKEYAHFRAT